MVVKKKIKSIITVMLAFVAVFLVSFFIRFDFNIPEKYSINIIPIAISYVFSRLLSVLLIVNRISNFKSMVYKNFMKLGLFIFTGSFILLLINWAYFEYNTSFLIPNSLILIDFVACANIFILLQAFSYLYREEIRPLIIDSTQSVFNQILIFLNYIFQIITNHRENNRIFNSIKRLEQL